MSRGWLSARRERRKRKRELPTSFDLLQRSFFPTVAMSAKYATTYKKTATTCSLQAPYDTKFGANR